MRKAVQGFTRRRTVQYVDEVYPRRTQRIGKIAI